MPSQRQVMEIYHLHKFWGKLSDFGTGEFQDSDAAGILQGGSQAIGLDEGFVAVFHILLIFGMKDQLSMVDSLRHKLNMVQNSPQLIHKFTIGVAAVMDFLEALQLLQNRQSQWFVLELHTW